MGRANRDILSNIFSRISSLGSPRKLSHGLNKNIEEISPGIKCWPSFFFCCCFLKCAEVCPGVSQMDRKLTVFTWI